MLDLVVVLRFEISQHFIKQHDFKFKFSATQGSPRTRTRTESKPPCHRISYIKDIIVLKSKGSCFVVFGKNSRSFTVVSFLLPDSSFSSSSFFMLSDHLLVSFCNQSMLWRAILVWHGTY